MTTNTITIIPFRGAQWNVWAKWVDNQGELVGAGASYVSGALEADWYGSVGMIMPYLESNAVVSSAKLIVRGDLPPGSTLSSGTLSMTIFDFSSPADGRIYRNPDKSISMQANSTATFDIDPSLVKSFTYNFGIFFNFVPAQKVQNAYLFLYPSLEITYETYDALPPDTLSPNGINQNPNSPISLSWFYRSSGMPGDYQTWSEIEYTSVGGFGGAAFVDGSTNTWDFGPGYFNDGDTVEWRARTVSALLGFSDWSEPATFKLAITPPLQSILIYPLDARVPGTNGVNLEWRYSSQYDTNPSRFDIRYNRDGGEWIELTTDGAQSIRTQPILTQDLVTWQVKAYGEWGDEGKWSELGKFWTIGIPDAPTIVSVTNSNRPTINFSAENLMSWELQITDSTNIIYNTGNQIFINEFSYQVSDFLHNGNYVARMKITNEHGLASEWGALAFSINTVPPEPLKLQITSNLSFNIRLYFDNTAANTVYVYRSELHKNSYLRIGRTTGTVFDDFTVRPKQRYDYFVRMVNEDNSFADSNFEAGSLDFLETTLAENDNPQNMLIFLSAMGGKPKKDISFNYEKTLTRFIGREKPVLQIGSHSDKSISFSFYCTIAEYERLERLHRSGKVLILRDWRVGNIYGTINGAITASRETEGFIISFVFTQTDFNEEVELI